MVAQSIDRVARHVSAVVASHEGHLGYELGLTIRYERSGYSFAVNVVPTLGMQSELVQQFDESVARRYGQFILIETPQILQSAAAVIYAVLGTECEAIP